MMNIRLPICKSLTNRVLVLKAVRGEDVSAVVLPDDAPDDVRLLHDILSRFASRVSGCAQFDCQNCGTAFRFLTAFFATQEGCEVLLTGIERMQQRPIGQLVSALQSLGADIVYEGQAGFPPLRIRGKKLRGGEVTIVGAESSQFVSALMLVSEATEQGIQVNTDDDSPYIEMTRKVILNSQCSILNYPDWSSAAFWYEYVALYGGSLVFDNLHFTGLQGDEVVADIFAQLGVQTEETEAGIRISKRDSRYPNHNTFHCSLFTFHFSHCPDLYPAVYMTCQRLGVELHAEGTERLVHKESDRLKAFEQLQEERAVYDSYHDHRVAMALLMAGYRVNETACISKSYPQFMAQYERTVLNYVLIVPCRNITHLPLFEMPPYARVVFVDDHSTDGTFEYLREHYPHAQVLQSIEPQGKKGALRAGVLEAQRQGAEYVWLTDYDVQLPKVPEFQSSKGSELYILPLQMDVQTSFLERLQVIEYVGIQSVTMETAERGRAVMAAGANLLVRTSVWLECYEKLHLDEPSGDDMYLLEAVKRRGLSVSTMRRPIAQIKAISEPLKLFRQRCRWAGKVPHYTDKDIRRYGAMVLILNVLAVVCPPIWFAKFAFEWHYLHKGKHYGLPLPKHAFVLSILLSIVYPWYMLACLIGGLCLSSKRHW